MAGDSGPLNRREQWTAVGTVADGKALSMLTAHASLPDPRYEKEKWSQQWLGPDLGCSSPLPVVSRDGCS